MNVSAVTPRAGASVEVAVRGLLAGERWTVRLDGRLVRTGVSRFGGTARTTVALPRAAKDTVHVLRVSGDRRVTDPAVSTSSEAVVTSVVARKALRLTGSGRTLTVRGLAAKERVTVQRGRVVIATGRADADGVFTVTTPRAPHGTYSATGSTRTRTGAVRLP